MRPPLIPTLAAAAAVALTASLGTWQLRRADEKAALQAARDAALADVPVAVDARPVDARALDGRRVVLRGRFDATRTVFLDNRTRRGVAGFHVLAPLRPEGADPDAPHVMVLRGWIARDPVDRARVPALVTPEGAVRVEGLAAAELAQPIVLGGADAGAREGRILQRYDPAEYAAWAGLAVQPIVVRQTSALDDGLARDWAEPGGGVDRHLGYAFQWFAMAAAVVALWAWFAVIAPRRRARALSDSPKES